MLASLGCPCSLCQGGSGRAVNLLPLGSCYPAQVFCPEAVSVSISLACGNTWPYGSQSGGAESEEKRMCSSCLQRAGFQVL